MSDDVMPGCCTRCGGTGASGDPDANGQCSDCLGTGHAHLGPCAVRGLAAAGLLAVTPTSKPRELLDRYAASEYDIVLESEYAVPPVTGSVPRTAVAPAAFAALRAVLDLHSPVEQHGATWCAEDGDYWWPCPTVQAITTALTAEEATDA